MYCSHINKVITLKFMSSVLKCVSTVHIIKACTLHLFLQRYTLVKVHLKTKHLKKIMVCSGKFIITTFFKDKNIYFFCLVLIFLEVKCVLHAFQQL